MFSEISNDFLKKSFIRFLTIGKEVLFFRSKTEVLRIIYLFFIIILQEELGNADL